MDTSESDLGGLLSSSFTRAPNYDLESINNESFELLVNTDPLTLKLLNGGMNDQPLNRSLEMALEEFNKILELYKFGAGDQSPPSSGRSIVGLDEDALPLIASLSWDSSERNDRGFGVPLPAANLSNAQVAPALEAPDLTSLLEQFEASEDTLRAPKELPHQQDVKLQAKPKRGRKRRASVTLSVEAKAGEEAAAPKPVATSTPRKRGVVTRSRQKKTNQSAANAVTQHKLPITPLIPRFSIILKRDPQVLSLLQGPTPEIALMDHGYCCLTSPPPAVEDLVAATTVSAPTPTPPKQVSLLKPIYRPKKEASLPNMPSISPTSLPPSLPPNPLCLLSPPPPYTPPMPQTLTSATAPESLYSKLPDYYTSIVPQVVSEDTVEGSAADTANTERESVFDKLPSYLTTFATASCLEAKSTSPNGSRSEAKPVNSSGACSEAKISSPSRTCSEATSVSEMRVGSAAGFFGARTVNPNSGGALSEAKTKNRGRAPLEAKSVNQCCDRNGKVGGAGKAKAGLVTGQMTDAAVQSLTSICMNTEVQKPKWTKDPASAGCKTRPRPRKPRSRSPVPVVNALASSRKAASTSTPSAQSTPRCRTKPVDRHRQPRPNDRWYTSSCSPPHSISSRSRSRSRSLSASSCSSSSSSASSSSSSYVSHTGSHLSMRRGGDTLRSQSQQRQRYRRRSRSRSPSRSHSQGSRWKRDNERRKTEEQKKQIEDRRVVHVGNIPVGTTKMDLRNRFRVFGTIEDITLHYRERSRDYFGFITFTYTCDAFEALEHGNDDPSYPKCELSPGGRRMFCLEDYSDLDSLSNRRRQMMPPMRKDDGFNFDDLLKAAKDKMRSKPS